MVGNGAEDVLGFPALRAVDPALGPVVDCLESDHARVPTCLTSAGKPSASTSSTPSITRSATTARRCAAWTTLAGA